MTTSKHETLVNLLHLNLARTLEIASFLKEIRDGELYTKEIGQGIDTWHDYLSQPEIGMTVHEANTLINLMDYMVRNGIDPDCGIPTKTLKFLAKNNIDNPEIIYAASQLTHKDFKELHYDKGSTKPRTYTYMLMKRCNETGNLTKVHGIESSELEDNFKDKLE